MQFRLPSPVMAPVPYSQAPGQSLFTHPVTGVPGQPTQQFYQDVHNYNPLQQFAHPGQVPVPQPTPGAGNFAGMMTAGNPNNFNMPIAQAGQQTMNPGQMNPGQMNPGSQYQAQPGNPNNFNMPIAQAGQQTMPPGAGMMTTGGPLMMSMPIAQAGQQTMPSGAGMMSLSGLTGMPGIAPAMGTGVNTPGVAPLQSLAG